MEIATVLHIHNNELLVRDTLDSVLKYVGSNVLVIYDGAVGSWGANLDLPALEKSCPPYDQPTGS